MESMDGLLRTGVVGTGSLGFHHARILRDVPEVQMAGIFDVRPERSLEVSRELEVRAFDDLDALLAPLIWLEETLAPWRAALDPETEQLILWAWRHRHTLELDAGEGFPPEWHSVGYVPTWLSIAVCPNGCSPCSNCSGTTIPSNGAREPVALLWNWPARKMYRHWQNCWIGYLTPAGLLS